MGKESHQSVAIEVVSPPPTTAEERARDAGEKGNIEALYELIREKPKFLKEMEEEDFVDTPLHAAAAAGKTEFAMEMMYLKPSLLRKLNHDGLSPIHLALQNGHAETARSLLKYDPNIARIKGKKGFTPLHYAVMRKEHVRAVLTEFLQDCPECIHDVTSHTETAFHVAAKHENPEAVKVLLLWLLMHSDCNISQIRKIMNWQNKERNTVLQIAQSNNQPEIVNLLKRCWLVKKSTASDNLQGGNQERDKNKESLNILRCFQHQHLVDEFTFSRAILVIRRMKYRIRHMSGGRSNALLVATVLILTATYQAALSPPGGVYVADSVDNTTAATTSLQIFPSDNTPTHHHLLQRSPFAAGASILSTAKFLWFFIPNIAAFSISFLVTCFALISILPGFLSFTLVLALILLLFCLLMSAVLILSPNTQSLNIMFKYVYILYYVLSCLISLVLGVVLLRKIKKIEFKKLYMRNQQAIGVN